MSVTPKIEFDNDGLPIPPKRKIEFDEEGLPIPGKVKVPKAAGEDFISKVKRIATQLVTNIKGPGGEIKTPEYPRTAGPVEEKIQVTEEEQLDPNDLIGSLQKTMAPLFKQSAPVADATYVRPSAANIFNEQERQRPEVVKNLEKEKQLKDLKNAFTSDVNLSTTQLMRATGKSANEIQGATREELAQMVRQGNQSDNLAAQTVADAKDIRQVFSESDNLEQAAIQLAALKDPQVARQIEITASKLPARNLGEVVSGTRSVMGDPKSLFGEATLGRMIYQLASNPVAVQEIEKNPELKKQFREAIPLLINEYPSFGKSYLGNVISQKMEDMGMNNALLNIVTKEETDKVVDQLATEGKMSPTEVQFYKDNMREGGIRNFAKTIIGEQLYKTPGLIERTGESAVSAIKATGAGAAEVTGLRPLLVGERAMVARDVAARDEAVNIRPRGTINEISAFGGDFLGQVLPTGLLGKGLTAAKVFQNPDNAIKALFGLQAFGNYMPQARAMFPGEGLKQRAYSGILAGLELATENIFRDKKVVDGLLGKVKPEIASVINKFTAKEISAAAAREAVEGTIAKAIRSVPQFTKYFAKGVGENTFEETIVKLGEQLTDGVFTGKKFNDWVNGEELLETARTSALGSTFIAGLSARADMLASKGMTAKMVYDMAEKPEYWIEKIRENAETDPDLQADAEDKIANLEYATKVRQDLEKTNLTEKQKIKFLINALDAHVKGKTSQSITDPVLKKRAEQEAKVVEQQQNDILDGVDQGEIEGDRSDEVAEPGEVAPEVPATEITEQEYTDFIDKGIVTPERLNDIAQKVKGQEKLSEREQEIFTDKTADINKIIAGEVAPEVPQPTKAGSVGVGGEVVVSAKPKPIDEQSIAASQKWIKDLYSLPESTRIQDKNGNVYDIVNGKIRKLTLDKEGNVIDAEIIHTDRDVHKRGAYSNPDFFNEGYKVLPEQSLKETPQAETKTVEQLRAAEQAEYAAMADPNDQVKRKEIYDRYDKLITPLLEKEKAESKAAPVPSIIEVKSPKEVKQGDTVVWRGEDFTVEEVNAKGGFNLQNKKDRTWTVKDARITDEEFQGKRGEVAAAPAVQKFGVGFAPFREKNVFTEEEDVDIRTSPDYQLHQENVQKVAEGLGIKINNKLDTWGGYVDSETGNPVQEVSNIMEIEATPEQARVMAAILGKAAPEMQDSVLLGNYNEQGAGFEHVISTGSFNNALRAAKYLKDNGLQYFTIDKSTGDIIILDTDNSVRNNIDNFIDQIKENGIEAEHTLQGTNAEFIGREDYDSILSEQGRKIGQQKGFDIDAFVQEAAGKYDAIKAARTEPVVSQPLPAKLTIVPREVQEPIVKRISKSIQRIFGKKESQIATLTGKEWEDALVAAKEGQDVNFQSWGAFEKTGFEETPEYKKLLSEGKIREAFDIKNIAGKPVVVINPDNMMTGVIISKDGKPIINGNGGINFVSKFGDVWASSDQATATTLAKYINEARELDLKNGGDGIVQIVVTKGTLAKSLTSHTGAKGAMAVLENLVDKGFIGLKDFRKALTDVGKKYGIDFDGRADAKSIHSDIASKFFGVDDSSFSRRGTFIEDVINHLAENSESVHNNIEGIREALNSKELISEETGKPRKINFARAGVIDALGLLFSDNMTKGVPSSHAYATIEVSKPVKVEKGEHESYPFHIRQEDGSRPTLNILSDKRHVTEIVNDKNNAPVLKNIPKVDTEGNPILNKNGIQLTESGAGKLGSNQIGMAKGFIKSESELPKDDVKYMTDSKGNVYGFEKGGNIFLNGDYVNPNTPIHEAGHIWTNWAEQNRGDLFNAGLSKIEGSRYLKDVQSNPFYQEQASKLPESQRQEYFRKEALAKAIGDNGEKFVTEAKKNDFKQWILNLWRNVIREFGIRDMSAEQLSKLTIDEFSKKVAADIFGGKAEKVKTQEYAVQEQTAGKVPVQPKARVSEEVEGREPGAKLEEAPKEAKAEGKEKVTPGEMVGIKHEATEEMRLAYSLPEYERPEGKTMDELEAEADQKIKAGYNVESLIKKLEDGNPPSGVENVILAKYLGVLNADFDKTKNKETLAKIERVVSALDIIGTIQSEAFRTRKIMKPKEDTLAQYFMDEKADAGVEELTEQQEATITREYEEIKAAKEALQKKVEELQEQNAKLLAEGNISEEKNKVKKTRKTDADFKQERKNIVTNIKDKLKKARTQSNVTVVPYANELFTISPEIAKLVKSYVEQGIVKLEDIVNNIHELLKDDIKDITKKDVQDLIAGEYQKKKPTKNELAAKVRDLKTEAKLLVDYEKLEAGVPKTEKQKIEKNRGLADLRKRIKEHDLTKLSEAKSRMKAQIEKVEQQIAKGDFEKAPEKKVIKLDEEGRKLQAKLTKLKKERDVRRLTLQYQKQNKVQRTFNKVLEVFNIPRSLMASTDFSAPLNQAVIATINYPKEAKDAAVQMVKAAASQEAFDNWFYDLKETPRYDLMNKLKLGITDPFNPELTAREEAFMSGYAEQIPGVGKLVKGSERAYVQYLNKLRVDLFNKFIDRFEEQGKTYENNKKLYEATAKYINNITGRGELGPLKKFSPLFSALFFSPRLMAARINMLNPYYFATLPTELKKQYGKDMGTALGILSTMLTLFALYGKTQDDDDEDKITVETDPRSSDFGRVRQGDTRWDFSGGFQPYIRAVTQFTTAERKKTSTGEIMELEGKMPGSGRQDIVLGFFRNKLAPVPSMIIDFTTGKNAVGEKVELKDELLKNVIPLSFQSIYEGYEKKGPQAIATVGLPAIFGVGVSTYEQRKKEVPETIMFQDRKIELSEEQREEFQRIFDERNTKNLERLKALPDYKNSDKIMRGEMEQLVENKSLNESKELLGKKYRRDFLIQPKETEPKEVKRVKSRFKID